jgi:hypothetical protein
MFRLDTFSVFQFVICVQTDRGHTQPLQVPLNTNLHVIIIIITTIIITWRYSPTNLHVANLNQGNLKLTKQRQNQNCSQSNAIHRN